MYVIYVKDDELRDTLLDLNPTVGLNLFDSKHIFTIQSARPFIENYDQELDDAANAWRQKFESLVVQWDNREEVLCRAAFPYLGMHMHRIVLLVPTYGTYLRESAIAAMVNELQL
jgi:hypothetical protein